MAAPQSLEVNTISVTEFLERIHDKVQLHEALLRSGYFLPQIKSGIITQDFLVGVSQGKIWCPLYKDIKMVPCPRPPTKNVIIKKLEEIIKNLGLHLKLEDSHLPNKSWAVIVLGTLKPSDEIFSKNYLPPSTHVAPSISFKSISFPKSILSGLPVLPSKTKRVRLKMIQEGKEVEHLITQQNKKTAMDIHIRTMEDKIRAKNAYKVGLTLIKEFTKKNMLQKAEALKLTDSKMRNANEEDKE